MPFSSRQMHCMQAMGLVPWVSEGVPLSAPVSAPVSITDMETDTPVESLGAWLQVQTLASNAEPSLSNAPLLVVVESIAAESAESQPAGQSVLTGEAAQLFDLMMRSINLKRGDVRQCLLAGTQGPTVAQSCTVQTRAVLFLSASHPDSAQGFAGELPSSSHPVWRIPHPELLLAQPLHKRQAWESLKQVQKLLAGFQPL